MNEIFHFTQSDLANDDVMILDTYAEVFVWVGHEATEAERVGADETAASYVAAVREKDSRSEQSSTIIKVTAGSEPFIFTAHFHGWSWNTSQVFEDPYDIRRRKIEERERNEELAKKEADARQAAADAKKQEYERRAAEMRAVREQQQKARLALRLRGTTAGATIAADAGIEQPRGRAASSAPSNETVAKVRNQRSAAQARMAGQQRPRTNSSAPKAQPAGARSRSTTVSGEAGKKSSASRSKSPGRKGRVSVRGKPGGPVAASRGSTGPYCSNRVFVLCCH